MPIAELTRRLAPIGAHGLRRLAGGQSSLTYAARDGDGRDIVVKVAPAGVAPVLNRDVLRQACVLRALDGTAVPVPTVVWEDSGDPPDVPPLFVMTFLPGESVEPLFDDGIEVERGDATTMAARLHGANRVMRALHALDPAAIGLGGEPVVALDDEVERWVRLLQTVDAALVTGWQRVAAALHASTPAPHPPAVVHGDFRLGNLLADGSTITGVIDWEIWTIGDPRVDVGWFLANADSQTYDRVTPYTGRLPGPADLLAAHGAPPDCEWFIALASFKAAAVWALIVKHNARRARPDPAVVAMAGTLSHLLRMARSALP